MRFYCDWCGISFESPDDVTGETCNSCGEGTMEEVDLIEVEDIDDPGFDPMFLLF